nr:hypothetical protein [Candidatus Sigynarchaeum springense]MDO8115742.1 hypothetical protein [Candidatus Sigynarchaeota archaeon]
MVKTATGWAAADFGGKRSIFDLFTRAKYDIGDVEPVNPELVFGAAASQIRQNVQELYQVVREGDFQAWFPWFSQPYGARETLSLGTKVRGRDEVYDLVHFPRDRVDDDESPAALVVKIT